jgi:hypothetical protein
MPAKGESLRLGRISETNMDVRVQEAMRRLARNKAPQSVSQVVMWRLLTDASWENINRIASPNVNSYEMVLAREFVDSLDRAPDTETGEILFQVDAATPKSTKAVDELREMLNDKVVLGLRSRVGTLADPDRPAVACRVQVGEEEAVAQVYCTGPYAAKWLTVGKFTVEVPRKDGKVQSLALADTVAANVLPRLVRAKLLKGPHVKGKETFSVRIENGSPLVLSGIAVLGQENKADELPKVLLGLCVGPHRSFTVPASAEVVKALNLKQGIRLVAADVSGL